MSKSNIFSPGDRIYPLSWARSLGLVEKKGYGKETVVKGEYGIIIHVAT